MAWFVYVLACSDSTLYTGITTDVNRRAQEHNDSHLGAKYTKGRRPVSVLYQRAFANRSLASQAEAQLKKLNRKKKLEFIQQSE